MGLKRRDAAAAIRALSLFGTAPALLLTAAQPAAAAGFYLQEQSVRGWGRANSGEVADQGPASLWWNPAAIGWDEETSVAFGATGILPSGRIEDQGTLIDRPGVAPVPVGGPALMRDPVQKGLVPGSAFSLPLGNGLALGLAVAAPFGFTTDYDPAGWQRYSAIRTRLITLDVQPSLAWAPNAWLSVGAGLNVEYADAFLSNALPNLAPGSADGRVRLEGAGWDLGWSAGVQLRPAPRVTLGLAYKSAIEHKLNGRAEISGLTGALATRNFAADAVASFDTPWQLIAGARAGVSAATTFNLQAVRFGWSRFDRIDLGAPLSSFIAQNYKNTWSFAFGVDHDVSSRLTVRTGIQFDPTPTRDASRDPRVPDGDRIDYNVGATWKAGGGLRLEAGAALTDLKDVPIERDERFYAGTPAQVDVLTSGRGVAQRVIVVSVGGRLAF
jgi:long-chain fatty acid transport protein